MIENPLSFAMRSALEAVARMKGDSRIAWGEALAENGSDPAVGLYRQHAKQQLLDDDPVGVIVKVQKPI